MDKLILVFLCFLVYFNSLNGQFISDDIEGIVNNPLISFSKANPIPWHLINVSLHCIAVFLVFYFLKKFFKPLTALLGACLFAIHPIHTEAVSWISGKPYIIMAIVTFGIYFLYERKKIYPLALLIFILYSIKNPQYCILIGLFLLLMNIVNKKDWLKTLAFLPIASISIFLHKGDMQSRIVSVAQDAGSKWTNPILNMVFSIIEHTKLLVFPYKLTLYHEPNNIHISWMIAEVVIVGLLLLCLPFIYKKAKPIFLAIGILGIFLLFTYNPVMVAWLVAERYLYIPVISLSLILCFFYERFESKKALAVFIAVLFIYGARTVIRNEDWKTPNKFWRATVEISSLSPRAHNNMGDVFAKEGNITASIMHFRKAIELNPKYAEGYYNLASIYKLGGEAEIADKLYIHAFNLKPELKNIKR